VSEEFTRDLPSNRSFEERVFARLDAIDAWFLAIDARFDVMESRFEARFDALEARFELRFNAVDARLDGLDIRVHALEARALDTKPIWERALVEILEVKEGVEDIQRKFQIVTEDLIKVRADQRRIERRTDALEGRHP
jgi:hypothetical protein